MRGVKGHSALTLESRFVGGLPLVNAILERLQVDRLLARALPRGGRVRAAQALGILLRNIVLNDRQPIYTHAEWAARAEPSLLGLAEGEAAFLNDDRVGRALDRLFDADRAALMTDVVLRTIREFAVALDQLHNDSTTLTLTGVYRNAQGQAVRGKPTARITFGHNKDHRPDLQQLLFVLTVSADGAVPIHYRALDGNTNDATTHIETWETLCRLAGQPGFTYVADCKLCSKATLAHIDQHRGLFITVLPRKRREDRWFRTYLQTHDPPWEEVVRRPNARRRSGPEDVWKVVEAAVPSQEGYRIVWVWNSLKAKEDAEARQARIEKASLGIERLQTKLTGTRCRLRLRERVEAAARKILKESGAERWVRCAIEQWQEPVYRQEKRGHPGPATRYLRTPRPRFSVAARVRDTVVAADERSDGMFPLITNGKELSLRRILEAYKFQPTLEKRHQQLKSVQHVAPVWLKNVSRIEALLFLYFVALLVHALLEREVRRAMARTKLQQLPLYPEERECQAPSTERILDTFAPLQRHRLRDKGRLVQTFEPELTDLHRQILALLCLPASIFRVTG
ncbi:MAG: transposase [Anaerolinea sp.]|nr:transposase [Anaerolinea sp.]